MANQTSIAARKIRPDGDVGLSRTTAPAAGVIVLQPAFVPPSNVHSAPLRHPPTTEVSSSVAASRTNSPIRPNRRTTPEATVVVRSRRSVSPCACDPPAAATCVHTGRRREYSKKKGPASRTAAAKFAHRTRTSDTGGPTTPPPARPPPGRPSPTPNRRNPLVV